MENIYELLKSVGVEVPADKKESFDKAFNENYKTIAEVDGIKAKLTKAEEEKDSIQSKYDTDIAARDKDLEDLKTQLANAGEDASKLADVTSKLETLQSTYDSETKKYKSQLEAQKYEFLVREKANGIKFTSNAAKTAFVNDLIQKNLPVENDSLLGLDDFVNTYKEKDAGAFVADEGDDSGSGNDGKPHFLSRSNNNNSGDGDDKPKARPLIL